MRKNNFSIKWTGSASYLGERKVIELMRRCYESMPDVVVPFGDDVSVVPGGDELAVLKTDMLVGKTDVPRGMSFWQAARKAIVMNVSDFAAKGVQPKAALVALGVPHNFMSKDLEEIAKGLNAGSRQYGLYIVGGDTNETSDLILSISLFGSAKKDSLMLRRGAKPGDILAVTGFFGKTGAGMEILMNGYVASDVLREVLVGAVYMPQARLNEGLALQGSGAISSSIDSSDGLAASLYELAKMSNVGFVVSALPVAHEVKVFADFNGLDPYDLSLYGGEEYELVLTVNPKLWSKAETAIEAVGGQLLPIGKVVRDQKIILDFDGEKKVIKSQGWEHFKANNL